MQHVNVYTVSGIRSLRPGNGMAGYILELKTEKGPVTFTKTAKILNATANQAELKNLIAALRRLVVKCSLTIYTESGYVAAGLAELPRWRRNGWKTSRGTDVANKDEWRELAEILNGQETEVLLAAEHEYRAWLKNEVTRKE